MEHDDKVVVLHPDEDGKPSTVVEGPHVRVEPDELLAAAAGKLREVVIVGITLGGDPLIYASDGHTRALTILQLCKAELTDIMRSDLGWLVPGDLT